MSKNNIIELEGREGPVDPLSERLLWGAQKLIRVLNYLLNYPLNSLRLKIKYFYAELL